MLDTVPLVSTLPIQWSQGLSSVGNAIDVGSAYGESLLIKNIATSTVVFRISAWLPQHMNSVTILGAYIICIGY